MPRGPSKNMQSAIGRTIRGSWRYGPTDGRANKCYRWQYANAALIKTGEPFLVSRNVAKGLARLMCKVALQRLADKYGVSPERIAAFRAEFRAKFTKEEARYCHAGENGAYFAHWGWSPGIIAHEVAHWADTVEMRITNSIGQRTGHGPAWLGWFAFLLIDVVKVDRSALVATLATARLRYVLP